MRLSTPWGGCGALSDVLPSVHEIDDCGGVHSHARVLLRDGPVAGPIDGRRRNGRGAVGGCDGAGCGRVPRRGRGLSRKSERLLQRHHLRIRRGGPVEGGLRDDVPARRSVQQRVLHGAHRGNLGRVRAGQVLRGFVLGPRGPVPDCRLLRERDLCELDGDGR